MNPTSRSWWARSLLVRVVAVATALGAAACANDSADTAPATTAATTDVSTAAAATTSASASTSATPTSGGPPTTTSPTTELPGEPGYETAPCPNPIVAGVPQIDLGPDFECGYLTVPENRSNRDGRTIRIAVARVQATDPNPKPDPIVYLAGGPGGTGLASAVQRVAASWNVDREVIFIDQRGTLKADPLLSCPEIDTFSADAVYEAATDPATRTQSGAATRECYNRFLAAGYDLGAYDTAENAADVADLRIALGIDEWNLYGVSYGTDLALQTARDHPEGIRSLILDSVVPPQTNLANGFWPNAAQGYEALFDACAAEAACASAFPDVEAEFMSLVTSLAEQPRSVAVTDPTTEQPVTVVIDGYTFANLVVVASLIPGSIAKIPAMIHDLATGQGTLAAEAVLAGRPPSGIVGYGLALGVFCSEQVPFTSAELALSEAKSVLPNFPDAVLSLLPQAPYMFSDCVEWNIPKADDRVHEPARTDIPVLLLAGSLDAITPPSWAELAASTLPNGRLVTIPGAGHDVMIWSPDCAVPLMQSFLNQPTSPDDSCIADLTVPPFVTT